MSNLPASTFLHAFVADSTMQQQLKASIMADGMLTFAHWQKIANQHGWNFTETEFQETLVSDSSLLTTLEQLAEANGLWFQTNAAFELSEEELETVAGGGPDSSGRAQENGSIPLALGLKI